MYQCIMLSQAVDSMNICSLSAGACQGPAASWFRCQHLSSLVHPKTGRMMTSSRLAAIATETLAPNPVQNPSSIIFPSLFLQTISNMSSDVQRVSLSMHLARFMRLSIRNSVRGHPAKLTTPQPIPWIWTGRIGKCDSPNITQHHPTRPPRGRFLTLTHPWLKGL